jgi:hypothetical protein
MRSAQVANAYEFARSDPSAQLFIPVSLFAMLFTWILSCFWVDTLMQTRKLHRGTAVIEVTDPLLLTEIESDAALQPFLGERLSERHIAVQNQAAGEVVQRLQSLGHMPRVVE